MQMVRRFWHDLSNFENLDLYVTIVLAIGLSLLNLLGTAPDTYIQPLTLAVLGLLALTSLVNRHRIDDLHQAMIGSPIDLFVEEFPESMKSDLASALDLWLVGVSLHRTINFNYATLERKLQQGHRLRIMVVHPDGPGVEMAASRNYRRKEATVTSSRIRDNLQLLCDLQALAPDRVELRTIQNPLSYGVVAANPDTATGVLYIEHYTFGTSPVSMPRYVIRAQDGRWYDFFKQEILAMWDYGVTWQC